MALRWDFSDGGVAFGPHPSHTFADNGHYTGQLTATDQAGNATTQAFEVEVSNQNPAAIAGSQELRFVPAKLRGEPMAVSILFPVWFRHPEAPPLPGDTVLKNGQASTPDRSP